MNQWNAKNERVKRDYFRFQTEAKQKSKATLKGIVKAIDRFEKYNNLKDFSTFNKEQAIAFKKHLTTQKAERSEQPLSKATVFSTLNTLKDFFQWIAWQPGFKSKIHVPDIEYFNLSEKEISIAKAPKLKEFPSLEQIRKAINNIPTETVVNRRDRALLAFTILTGMRDAAIASLRIKHINLASSPIMVKQEPNQVNTKFSKQIFTHFLPVGDDFAEIFKSWMTELKESLYYSPNDPVFPRTRVELNDQQFFQSNGLEPVCWANASSIRQIFKNAFESAGLNYYNPHLFRDTLVHYGQEVCKTPEEFKAWSQSLGHSSPLTTFASYGNLDPRRQGVVLGQITTKRDKTIDEDTTALVLQLAERLKK
jgi:integrase